MVVYLNVDKGNKLIKTLNYCLSINVKNKTIKIIHFLM